MGLYIPGTSIRGCGVGGPIGCGCPCYNPYNGRCQVVNKDVGDPSVLGFPDFCPIIHVQSPHGKLGDLDRLAIRFWDGQCYFTDAIKSKIASAPTIIGEEDD